MMFHERKVAQMAAFFLGQDTAGKMSRVKLMKLLYLSDREAVPAFGWLISGYRLACVPQGPTRAQTLILMDGDGELQHGGWEARVSGDENHEASAHEPLDVSSLDELAPAEIETLKSVWTNFGATDKWETSDGTHQPFAERTDPIGSYMPVRYESLDRVVGFDSTSAQQLAAQIQAKHEIDALFAAL